MTRLLPIFGNFRVLDDSDWTEFGLVRPSLSSFDVSCHGSFAPFLFLLHDMSMGFIRAETTVICFAVM